MQTNNPLAQYFRQPAIYLRLPSQGRFWNTGSVELTPNGELPVLPMTAKDEITYRTPDALFNGSAVVSVIESCIPNIKNAWSMPACDMDTILVAIRIASYGHNLEIETECPKCTNKNEFVLDLRQILDNITTPDYSKELVLGDLRILFKPMNYQQINQINLRNFENQKLIQSLSNSSDDDDQKRKNIQEMTKKITDDTFLAVANNIGCIITPETQVNNIDFILEYLTHCDREIYQKIKETVFDFKNKTEIKPLEIDCTKCQHHYQQNFTLDMTSFFGDAS